MKYLFFAAAIIFLSSCVGVGQMEHTELNIMPSMIQQPDWEAVPPEIPPPTVAQIIAGRNRTPAPTPAPLPWGNAMNMLAEMRVGWNLGNTLDSHPGGNILRFGEPPRMRERMWGNPNTTRENIQAIADAGFNVLRVPVTWHPSIYFGCPYYTISEEWMEHVRTIVNYGLDAGMFVILNTHHDEFLPSFNLFDAGRDGAVRMMHLLWEQIAYAFRGYSHYLIFEGLNEPRTIGGRAEWTGGTALERYNLNHMNQAFVDAVRATGGNNATRVLTVSPYAASTARGAMEDLVLPTDPMNDEMKLVVSLHMYAPYEFALTRSNRMRSEFDPEQRPGDRSSIVNPLNIAHQLFVANGIPVMMGEMGAMNRNNPEARTAWAYFYASEARERRMPVIWWDNGQMGASVDPRSDTQHFGLLNRRSNEWAFPEVVDALMRATARD